jgi:hypothetical protein
MNIQKPFYILSAFTEDSTDEVNGENTSILETQLSRQGWGVKPVTGKYNNEFEISYLVTGADEESILRFAKLYNQECVLAVDANRHAELLYVDGTREGLGLFECVDKSLVKDLPAWTYDPVTQQYYATGV